MAVRRGEFIRGEGMAPRGVAEVDAGSVPPSSRLRSARFLACRSATRAHPPLYFIVIITTRSMARVARTYRSRPILDAAEGAGLARGEVGTERTRINHASAHAARRTTPRSTLRARIAKETLDSDSLMSSLEGLRLTNMSVFALPPETTPTRIRGLSVQPPP